jgi:outer membrane protein OmpA-like peptidoglycan-associated protein
MKIIYRISDAGYNKVKPKYINNRNCLWNAVNVFKDADWSIIADNVSKKTDNMSEEYLKIVEKYKDEFEDKAVLKFDNHKSFAVYYDTGSFALDSSAIYSINKAIQFTRDYDDYKITVLGFTDRTSSRDYNKVLSDKRANAVYEALIKRGIAKEKIKKVLFGEDYNSVNTRDGVGESFNRRVVIEVNATGKFDEEEFITEKGLEGGIIE